MNVQELDDFIQHDDAIAHYGIRGMKWGRRRYQNADGSLTAAGKERYGSGEAVSTGPDSKTLKSYAITANAVGKASGQMKLGPQKKRRDTSQYTTKELQEIVTRMNLDKQYNTMMDEEDYYKSGRAKVDSILAAVGPIAITSSTLLAAAASAAALAEKK